MDGAQFDRLSRLLAQPATRRAAFGATAAAAFGLSLTHSAAGKKRKNTCKGGCGICQVCKKTGKRKKKCVTAPDGTACTGGVCRAGTCTCVPKTCAGLGKTCGPVADGCGETLACGICGDTLTPSCLNGTCATCAAACPETCYLCYARVDGTTLCGGENTVSSCFEPCVTDADCPPAHPVCVIAGTARQSNNTYVFSQLCGVPVGICAVMEPC